MKSLICGLSLLFCLGSCLFASAYPTYSLLISNPVTVIGVTASPVWVTVNADPTFQNPEAWAASTWGDSREGISINPSMTMTGGIATTQLESHAGVNVWDAAAYKQDIYQGPSYWAPVPLTTPQQITYTVKSTHENVAGTSYFNLFFEVWCTFSSPTGYGGATMAEMMIQQRIIVNGESSASVGSYTFYDVGSFGQYYLSYRAPDILFNVWSTETYDLNSLLYNALASHYGVNLAVGSTYSIIIGIEGYSSNGGMGAQWSQVNYQKSI